MPTLESWPRPHFSPGGGDAVLLYAVFGDFPAELPPLSASRHRTLGPGEDDVRRIDRATDAAWLDGLTSGPLGDAFEQDDAETLARVRAAPSCLWLQAQREDPETLDYLRDAVGFVTFLLDHGGVGVLDVQTLRAYSPARWREELFDPAAAVPRHHVVILRTADDDERGLWLHTRGLRKFGRPDLSVPRTPPEHEPAIIDLCNRFIELLAFGGHVPEGQEVRMKALPPGLTCHPGGDLDDPEFNNVHLEVRWPRT